jgi:hypothetical protein
VKIEAESAIVDLDVHAKVRDASTSCAVLILLVLVGGLLLLLRRWWRPRSPWSLLLLHGGGTVMVRLALIGDALMSKGFEIGVRDSAQSSGCEMVLGTRKGWLGALGLMVRVVWMGPRVGRRRTGRTVLIGIGRGLQWESMCVRLGRLVPGVRNGASPSERL